MTSSEIVLDPKRIPDPHIEIIKNALVVPMGADGRLSSGVFREDTSFVEHSRTLLSRQRFTAPPVLDEGARIGRLAGRHVFGGIGRSHFGHFLTESITRFWAVGQSWTDTESVLMLPRPGSSMSSLVGPNQEFIDILTSGVRMRIIRRPLIVEELAVPTQGLGPLDWARGTRKYRRTMRARIKGAIAPDGPDKLYISRSRLSQPMARVDREEEIEALMTRAGYTVFHPQEHSLVVQCAAYRAARKIVGTDGSAFHLTPYVTEPESHLAIIQRRPRHAIFRAIVHQNEVFSSCTVTGFSPLQRVKPPKGQPHPLNLEMLEQRLSGAGLI